MKLIKLKKKQDTGKADNVIVKKQRSESSTSLSQASKTSWVEVCLSQENTTQADNTTNLTTSDLNVDVIACNTTTTTPCCLVKINDSKMTPEIKKIKLQQLLPTTLGELKKKISQEYELSTNVQNWFVGKKVNNNDENTTINELTNFGKNSLYLFVSAPVVEINDANEEEDHVKTVLIESNNLVNVEDPDIEKNDVNDDSIVVEEEEEEVKIIANEIVEEINLDDFEIQDNEVETIQDDKIKEYDELMLLQSCDIVPNVDDITCPICLDVYGPAEAVVLQDCLHTFCWTCLQNTIQHSDTPDVSCPFMSEDNSTCDSHLRQREIKALVSPEIFEKHLAKSVTLAENKAGKSAFHCQTPNCTNWCFIGEDDVEFPCGICNKKNCLKCRVMHDGLNCYDYQEKLRMSKEPNGESLKTENMLKEMLEKRKLMKCPVCEVMLTKIAGCDSIVCSICRTELCWPTKGTRWGPQGKGDTSGGCRCGVNGKKCHVNCGNCH
ncbi:ranBP-type and C3HC4-type zinc finger-containing protein 1-like [Aphidius gifuensis]|uniref:ranBP-type and C3HC4-type zinc finger-containing protein 1-like n=1 Tax=Aphidius gifuensis TaxID=684658 RepID=UPI001CDD7DEB|nr:ranBP-type and C3HC4-type zinc finger-containing protein 1-like [Aphidius gifuensis]